MNRLGLSILVVALLSGCGLGPDMTRDRIPPSPTPTPWQGEVATTEYIRQGDAAYASGDYASAIPHYKNAFDQDKFQLKLEKKALYGLIRNLATAYSKTGDARNARLVVAYGISKDYAYPMHHYTLAAISGDEGNEAEAISHLRTAYKNRNKLLPGETFPDPLKDTAFANMKDSETFKNAVRAMK
jgi:tetratricopeptide (TPR) repeat protein